MDITEYLRDRHTNLQKDQPVHFLCAQPNVTVAQLESAFAAIETMSQAGRTIALGLEPGSKFTPLHLATLNPTISTEIIMRLTTQFPEAPKVRDFQDALPLHRACSNPETPLEAIIHLTTVYPESVMAKDSNDKISLIRALEAKQPAPILQHLFACRPDDDVQFKSNTLQYLLDLIRNPPASLMAFPTALQSGWVDFISSDAILNMASAKDLEIFFNENATDNEIKALSAAEGEITVLSGSVDLTGAVINLIAHSTREFAQILSAASDLSGRFAMTVAVPPIKNALQDKLLFMGRYELVIGPSIHKSATCIVKKAVDFKAEIDYRKDFQKHVYKYNEGKAFICRIDFKKVIRDMGLHFDGDLFDEKFDELWDVDKGNNISEDEFVKFAVNELDHGEPRKVALKFMKQEDQFERELDSREMYDLDSQHVVAVLHTHGGKEDREDEKNRFYTDLENEGLEEYKHALVMPFADSNLDTIFRSQRPGPLMVRDLIIQIAKGTRHLHDQGVLHADLKVPPWLNISVSCCVQMLAACKHRASYSPSFLFEPDVECGSPR
jgi:hypothetical protein